MQLRFQFHKGTIRTLKLDILLQKLFLFQFHKGTIRTIVLTLLRVFFLAFNSIKVQLEPGLIAGAGSLIGFQFHKGTIRTFMILIMILLIKISIP